MEKLIMLDPKGFIASEIEPQRINGYLAEGWTVKSITTPSSGSHSYVLIVLVKK